MEEDLKQHILPWAEQFPERLRMTAFTKEHFEAAASWVASRAFGVDSHHGAATVTSLIKSVPTRAWSEPRKALTGDLPLRAGMSLCPLADAFNHKVRLGQCPLDARRCIILC